MTDGDRYTFENESSIPAGIADTIRGMLVHWDQIPSHAWGDYCTEDFEITLGGQRAQGLDAAKALRDATCHATNGPITNVQHTLRVVYLKAGDQPAQQRSDIVFTGSVKYTVLGGKSVQEDFATSFELQSVAEGQYRIKTARIFIDMVAMGQAMAELQQSS